MQPGTLSVMKRKLYSTEAFALHVGQNNYLYRTPEGYFSVVNQTYPQGEQAHISLLDEAVQLFKNLNEQVSFADAFSGMEMWK